MVGTFAALDLVVFYLFFEGGLIPMFLIIGVWGGSAPGLWPASSSFSTRCSARFLMLLAIMAMYWEGRHHRYPPRSCIMGFPRGLQTWAWLAFFASFAVKMPIVAGAHLAAGRPCRGADRGAR